METKKCPTCRGPLKQPRLGRRKTYCSPACRPAFPVERRRALNHKHNLLRYGLTPSDYERMLNEQGGACAICRDTPKGGRLATARLNIDHCHSTQRVRGLLCSRCNTALGLLQESKERAGSLLQYIEARCSPRS